jgi:hypothetical protein
MAPPMNLEHKVGSPFHATTSGAAAEVQACRRD